MLVALFGNVSNSQGGKRSTQRVAGHPQLKQKASGTITKASGNLHAVHDTRTAHVRSITMHACWYHSANPLEQQST
jgi:hypothetical protein